MNLIKRIIDKVRKVQYIDNAVIESLYASSKYTSVILIIFTALVTLALYLLLGIKIFIWTIGLILLLLYRSYNTYRFYTNKDTYSMKVWYIRFIVMASMTAIVYSILGFYHIHFVTQYYQLFIATVLLGLSAGSVFSLSVDIRTSILYVLILLVPLIITLLFIKTMPLHNILALILFLYCIAQVIVLYRINKQKVTIDDLESQHTIFHGLFKNAPLGVFTYNKNLEVLDCNEELAKVFKSDKKDIIGMNIKNLPDSRPLSIFNAAFMDGSASYEGPYTSLYGEYFWFVIKAFTFADKTNTHLVGIAIIENKTKEHIAVKKLEHMVNHDALTGLLNRRGITHYLRDLITNTNHQTHYSLLFYLDLNRFKDINDSLGHAIGDEVLLMVSQRLVTVLNKGCMVSRLGGDEFIIMLPHIAKDKDTSKHKSEKSSQMIHNAFIKPFIVQEMHLQMSTSIGIVLIEPEESNIEEIMRHADLSMYRAKNNLYNVSYYDTSLDKKQKELFLLQHDLAYITQRNQLELFFQPIVKMKNEELVSAELLIRWNHPTKGILSPEEFIPLSIKVGLLSKITWWIVDKACQQIARWKHDGQWKLQYISININATQLIEKDFAKRFFKYLNSYGLDSSDIILEITERSLIDNFSNAQSVINDLKSHGVRCAIDDFGTGYSSLSYLKKLSFEILKIDRTFIKDLGQSPKELILVNTILDIGRLFNYTIIIEGIENEQQKKALLELDDDLNYQGFFYNKPVKSEEFTKKFLMN